MTHSQLIEKEAERYAADKWGDAYDGILSPEIIQKGQTSYATAFTAGAHFALGLDRWVKVEDGCEMPENRTTILVCLYGEHPMVAHYKHGCWFDMDGLQQYSNITHWQPIAPPTT